jgi:ribosomal protein S27E
MGKVMCPGQDTAFWRPGDIYEVPCSDCGHDVEFFKDDATRRCTACGKLVRNPKLNLGCAQWCEHAVECLGYDPKEIMAAAEGGDVSLVDRLIAAMKLAHKKDQSLVSRALRVLERAKQLMKNEGGEPRVVLTGTLLHGLETQQAETLMKQEGLDEITRDRVQAVLLDLAGPGVPSSLEAKTVRDALSLVEYEDGQRQAGELGLFTQSAQGWVQNQAAQ